MKYTQIPTTAFKNIQLNAGILVDDFTPATGVIGNLIGATSGGINFTDTPSYKDFGEDIDGCPKKTKELMQIDSREVKMAGTFVTVTETTARMLSGSADIDDHDDTHIVPRDNLLASDFATIWWIGDYSDVNTGDNAGFIAIKLKNALNTAGFQIQSTDKDKGKFAFEFTGHYSMANQTDVPYELYVKVGSSTTTPSIYLDKHSIEIEKDDTAVLTATTVPADATVTWSTGNSSIASVSNGTVTGGSTAGNTIITASITQSGVTYNDTCTVVNTVPES